MKERLQLNIRMDNEPELFYLLKERADLAGLSVTSFVISALKTAVGWQPPIDNREIMSYIRQIQAENTKIREELQDYRKEFKSDVQRQQEKLQQVQQLLACLTQIDDPTIREHVNQILNE